MDNFYELKNDNFDTIIFGIENDIGDELLDKLNRGLSLIKPWKHGIPYYKNSKFCFKSLNSLCMFLFKLCKFTHKDIYNLNKDGWYVDNIQLSLCDTGISRMWCSYFDEDVLSVTKTKITDYLNVYYNDVNYRTNLDKDMAYYCYNKYYKNINKHY